MSNVVFSQVGGPADLILPERTVPIHGICGVNDDSGLYRSIPGVVARADHRAEAVPHGSAARLALGPNADKVLRVNGFAELTAHNCELFKTTTNAALNGHTSIEVDLSHTTVLDCSGLGALIALRNCVRRRDGGMRLLNPTRAARQLLEIVRAEQMFEIVHTVVDRART